MVKKVFTSLAIALIMMVSVTTFLAPVATLPVEAATGNLICKVFPFIENIGAFGINSLCGNVSATTAADSVRATFNLIVSLIFVAIIIFAIYIIIKAAIKYIRSEGDETKIQEAQKAIKSVFVGIAALFVGLLGIIILLAFFNVGSNALSGNGIDQTNSTFLQNLLNQ